MMLTKDCVFVFVISIAAAALLVASGADALSCSVVLDCTNHADNVNLVNGECVCDCRGNWTGAACQTCPAGYDVPQDCSKCSSGFEGYPHCERSCTTGLNCSKHATSVVGTWISGCNCTCLNQWSGDECQTCPVGWDASFDCGVCAEGYRKNTTSGECYAVCTSNRDCNGHASSVSGTPTTGCNCTCSNAWSGTTCDICPAGVDPRNCGSCLVGYVEYPRCIQGCTTGGNCSSHATDVSGNIELGCHCTCTGKWFGDECEKCPHGWDNSTSGDCARCAFGFGGATCTPICTELTDCSNHATTVTGTPSSGCNCSCRNHWFGADCSECPAGLDSSPSGDCGACLPNYRPYPECRRPCSSIEDCNGHAASVTGNIPDCMCRCANKWSPSYASGSNTSCNFCLPPFGGPNCKSCLEGYTEYPVCSKSCSMSNCTAGTTKSVSGNYYRGCTCSCHYKWTGPTCEFCPWGFDAANNCSSCAAGFAGTYPNCALACTSAANCTGRGGNVTGDTRTTCDCDCVNSWTGAKCTICPTTYNGTDCDRCADGFEGYPACTRSCTVSRDCMNHAVDVSGNEREGCNCTCNTSWYGIRCQSCPVQTDPLKNCAECVTGSFGYPDCKRLCTSTSDCLNHAANVSGTVPGICNCTCRNSWYGSRCQSCPAQYDGSTAGDCGRCRTGYGYTYPDCLRICTNSADCSGRAKEIQGRVGNCSCVCRNKWEGPRCNTCPAGFSPSYDCGRCSTGYSGYPNCSVSCTNSRDCNSHAARVEGNMLTGCTCHCAHQWEGKNCSVCPVNYDPRGNCARCNTGYTGSYPRCSRTCTVEQDCDGNNTVTVTGNYYDGCKCHCQNAWSGSRCDTCPLGFNATDDCSTCAEGYAGYPQCSRLCTLSNCSNNAVSVWGTDMLGCWCSCRNEWYGRRCQYCPARYNASDDCGSCAEVSDLPDFANYPSCHLYCTGSRCQDADKYVYRNLTENACYCKCSANAPSTCIDPPYPGGECAEGFYHYPRCLSNCSDARDCNGHGYVVSNSSSETGCNCTCRHQWQNSNCSYCPEQYNVDNDCYGCASGYSGYYPYCYRRCTTIQNCSGHATSVDGNDNTGCDCNCTNAWNGTECEVCPWGVDVSTNCGSCWVGHEDYPNCYKTCTVPNNCSNRAWSATGNSGPQGCNCNCRHKWEGDACDTCPAGYNATEDCSGCIEGWGGYPNCSPMCTVREDCADRAWNVTGTNLTGCHCNCRNEWTGHNCTYCPTAINGSGDADCSRCIDGYFKFPNCVRECTLDGDCSGHAHNVTGDGVVGCSCQCRGAWTGDQCHKCSYQYNASDDCSSCADGYSGLFPACYANCNATLACNDNAVTVTGNVGTGCNCTCRNAWTGLSCAVCPDGVVANDYVNGTLADCDQCTVGFIGYPFCERVCTNETDCSSHAVDVTGTISATIGNNCTCDCMNSWKGPHCNDCPVKFDALKNCGACSPDYVGAYPDCKKRCTKVENCNNHAAAVRGNIIDGCICTCLNKWEGNTCDTCPPLYDPDLLCGNCIAGYSEYPYCFRDCEASNCSHHAAWVDGNSDRGCNCGCAHQWSGKTCDFCPEGWDATRNCSVCATGYFGGNCSRNCTVHQDCNNHATRATGTTDTGCNCTCRNAWAGEKCDTCPYGTVQSTCGSCIPGFTGYPQCEKLCTVSANCSGNAVDVVGTALTGCNCTCRNRWSGDQCDVCPIGFNGATGCAACSTGYNNWPNCTRTCSASDCNFNAKLVTGNTYHGCNCTCRNQWQGEKCDTCPFNFDNSSDCGACARGFDAGVYPVCIRSCNQVQDCDNHATSAEGIYPNCSCTCRSKWTYSNCTLCPEPFYSTPDIDCNTCIPTWGGYPACSPKCTFRNCSGHSYLVEGTDATGCTCHCRNQWKGKYCDECPGEFDPKTDCSGCSANFEGTYPGCYLKCTTEANCTSHASAVTGNTDIGCQCNCSNEWHGDECQFCPHGVNSTAEADCAECIEGFSGFPNCSFTCTNFHNCSDHAKAVSGTTLSGCNCTCRNQWHGDACDICDSIYDSSKDCGACAAGRGDYPNCDPLCTIPDNCDNHATNVSGTIVTGCNCTCADQWSTANCSVCPPLFDEPAGCKSCIDGYSGYPDCSLTCTEAANCSDHATAVLGNSNSGCHCTCRHQWYDDECDSCPPTVNITDDCGSCIDTYTGYPHCLFLKCTVADNCTSTMHANNVTGDTNIDCHCNCSNHWTGSTCNFCPVKYDSTTNCDRCAPGYDQTTYPDCHMLCTNDNDCSGNAKNVTGNVASGCHCDCAHQWYGDICNRCPVIFSYPDNCAMCAPGYDTYPHCYRTCTNSEDCSNNAAGVGGNVHTKCDCDCAAQWTGKSCDVCPSQYDAADGCHRCSLHHENVTLGCPRSCSLAGNCSNHASSVTGNDQTGCHCDCLNSWHGDECQLCPPLINASQNCAQCNDGLEPYPACNLTSCTIAHNCSGRATAVSGNSETGCSCTCIDAWETSSNCGTCPPTFNTSAGTCDTCIVGYEGPTCNLKSCTIDDNCTGFATDVSGNSGAGCTCSCFVGYDPVAFCGACSFGFTGFPSCVSVTTAPPPTNGTSTTSSPPQVTNVTTAPPNATDVPLPNTTETPAGVCTVENPCNNHATSATFDSNSQSCNCSCRNKWDGNSCSYCPPLFNASADCGECIFGRTEYPSCKCEYHASGEITLHYPTELAMATHDEKAALATAVSADLTSFLSFASLNDCASEKFSGFVIQLSNLRASSGAGTSSVDIELDVAVVDASCTTAETATQCVTNTIATNCFPFTTTSQLMPSKASLFSCTAGGASAFRVGQTNPCGVVTCAAAQDRLIATSTNSPPDDGGSPVGMVVGIIVGLLLLLLIIVVLYKKVFYVKRRRGDTYADTFKFTQRFRLQSVAEDDLAATAAGAFGEELQLGRAAEEHMFYGNQRSQSPGPDDVLLGSPGPSLPLLANEHNPPTISVDDDDVDPDLPPPPRPPTTHLNIGASPGEEDVVEIGRRRGVSAIDTEDI